MSRSTAWVQRLARQLSKHSDAMAVIRGGTHHAKRRTARRRRRSEREALRARDHDGRPHPL